MAYDGETVFKRDNGQCRLRYTDCCTKQARTIVLHIPLFLGGMNRPGNPGGS